MFYAAESVDDKKTKMAKGNNAFKNAPKYFYRAEKPVEEGNFWHYVDGVPTIW